MKLKSSSLILFALMCYPFACGRSDADQEQPFKQIIVDANGPLDPWGKAVGDINGDGMPDLVVGGNAGQELVWYENPNWTKYTIASNLKFSTDHAVADLNGDGQNDIISLTKNMLVWFENPNWKMTLIDSITLHDIELADFDADGDLDIVGRNQSAFGGDGGWLHFYIFESMDSWRHMSFRCPAGEGLAVANIDSDHLPDVVVNGRWYRNPGTIENAVWQENIYGESWMWPHATITTADLNNDDRLDIVLAPAEREGERYRISWFEAPEIPQQPWQEHIVEDSVEAVHHFVACADFDHDGGIDIATAEMHQGRNPDEVKIFYNLDYGKVWQKRILSKNGSHNMQILDFDQDGDMDIFGANWSGEQQNIELWENQSCQPQYTGWQRHVVDSKRPWKAIFIQAADLNSDRLPDLVAGGWWYKNPGKPAQAWQRIAFGYQARNFAAIYDFNGDGYLDVLATKGKGAEANAEFVWLKNDGNGSFSPYDNIQPADGDFLQGVAVGDFSGDGRLAVALSWHSPGKGIQLLQVPSGQQDTKKWRVQHISEISQDEQLSVGDIDTDGDLDILLGSKRLRNDGNSWQLFDVFETSENPDRNRLADINGDGRVDAVVGFEAISKPGKLAWYEHRGDATSLWKEHHIAELVGPMSLDVADMDGDGDFDVIAGEHNLESPAKARLLIFENRDGEGAEWLEHTIYTGDEHHDGAQVVDIDGDGDLDIISIGWGHDNVVLYENKSCRF